MTRDEIIRLAKEAGFHDPTPADGYMGLAFDYRDGTESGASLERFAALVAAAEREEDAERQHAVELGKAMQRIACAAGIELMQPKEVADIVCGRLQWVDDELLNALKKRCYTISESHLSGYRLILGFNTLDDVHGAHQQIVKSRAIRPREVQPPKGED